MSLQIRTKLDEQVHVDVILGRAAAGETLLAEQVPLSRGRAISLVPFAGIRDAAKPLHAVLANEEEGPKYRRLAAVALWRLHSAEAREALLEAAETVKDPAVLTAVVKSLGRVGDERALPVLLAIERRGEGTLAAQASFAAALLAHRLNLAGHDLPVPRQFQPMPTAKRGAIEFTAPSGEEVELFTRTVEKEPYDIELSPDSLLEVHCTGGRWMLAFSQGFAAADSFAALRKKKTVVGVLARKSPEDGSYTVAYLLFAAPGQGRDHVDLLVHRSTGEQAWAGTITSAGRGQAKFVLHTAGRLGIVPIEVEGLWHGNGKVEITSAVSAAQVLEKQNPLRLEAPAV